MVNLNERNSNRNDKENNLNRSQKVRHFQQSHTLDRDDAFI